MKVAVCGAGVIGVTTAYYLAEMGHEVILVDRRPQPGMETSFANAGQISWGYAAPWAAPGVPLKALRWLFERHAPLRVSPRLDFTTVLWLLRMASHCNAETYRRSKHIMTRLARFSAECLHELRTKLQLRYDHGAGGTLQIFRTQKALDRAGLDAAVLRDGGVRHAILDRRGCAEVEPGLWPVQHKIVGGLYLPGDETGDCHLFTRDLARRAAAQGVTFRANTHVQGLQTAGTRISALQTDAGSIHADAFVVALGSHAPQLLEPLGVEVPVIPVKGYSATLPVKDDHAAPRSTVMDEAHKVAITRLGDRIRVGGIAEISGYDLRLKQRPCDTLAHVVKDLYGEGADTTRIQFWTGLRAMTPDGPPILGPSRYSNLFLNVGHGTLGWTMACGCARLTAELVSGEPLSMGIDELVAARYE